MGWPDVVCIQAISERAGDTSLGWFKGGSNAKRAGARLEDCGYHAVQNPDVKEGRWRFRDGLKRMVYVRDTTNITARFGLASNYARLGLSR